MNTLEKSAKLAFSSLLSQLRPANVAMFHIGRVGSTVLGQMLNQHPTMYWAKEFYLPRSIRGLRDHLGEDDPITLLRLGMSVARLRIFGFETKCHEDQDLRRIKLSMEEYVRELIDLGFTHFILLERRNLLRRFVSMEVGRVRKEWHNKGKSKLTRVHLDPDEVDMQGVKKPLIEWFDEINQTHERLRALLSGQDMLDLSYENDIRDDPTEAYRKVCDFLSIEPKQPKIELRKSNPFALRDMLKNYDEMARALAGTRHEWMLEEKFMSLGREQTQT